MNGRQQVQLYAQLASTIQPGCLVEIRQLGRAEVLEVLPEGMLKVRTANRCPVLVKASVCRLV